MIDKINEAKNYIQKFVSQTCELGIILGTGLGDLADHIEEQIVIDYGDIPHFGVSNVIGHAGKLIFGKLEGKYVVCMKGRFHYYEGWSNEALSLPIRVLHSLGVKTLFVSNAAGGLDASFLPGTFMIIDDHINFTGANPLIGKNVDEFGPRFPDLSDAYDKELIDTCEKLAGEYEININKGTYLAVSGPSFATKAELRMFIMWKASAIGMSTVIETIVAKHAGMRVFGISCITDCANPDIMTAPDAVEIVKTAELAKHKFIKLMRGMVKSL